MTQPNTCPECGETTRAIKQHLKRWHGYVYTDASPDYPVAPEGGHHE